MLDSWDDKKIQVDCIGRATEIIGYMVMSMRLTPSLPRAISFAAENMGGPAGNYLKKIIWNVYTRRFPSIEESFDSTSVELGKYNDELKRAMFSLRASTLESCEEDREKSLCEALDTVLSGTRKRMEEFASSLSTPTTILLALGIILPMMLGSMLPMISLGGIDVKYQLGNEESARGGGIDPVLTLLLMDVVFPLAAFVYAAKALSERPGRPFQVMKKTQFPKRPLVVLIPLGIFMAFVGMLNFATFGPYVVIWGIALPPAIYFTTVSWKLRKKLRMSREMEREFPEALYQLGTRICEGLPPERAIFEVGRAMKDAEIGHLFQRAYCRTVILGQTLKEAFFGEHGLLTDLSSSLIVTSMKSFIDIASKDSIRAGRVLIKMSEHLKELRLLEEETRRRLRASTESMKLTALLFSPIVMGVTLSLYSLLVETFDSVGGVGNMLSPHQFLMVLGVYVILMAAVAFYFVSGIEEGREKIERNFNIGVGMLISTCAFTISSVIGQSLL